MSNNIRIKCPKCLSATLTKLPLTGDCMYVAEEFGHDSEVFDAPVVGYRCEHPDCKCTFYVSESK